MGKCEIMKVNHIGYLVKNMEKAKSEFIKLGWQCILEDGRDTIRLIDVCLFEKDGYVVELISPYMEESVVSGLLKKYNNSPYHICYESQDFTQDLDYLKQNHYVQIGEPVRAPIFGNRNAVFLINSKLGMIELLETEPQI